ncbi:sugar kinase [Microbacteriaceae bacterium K1510]|nr:sugar kinase [Microbacteriaceae bacterium K1510]
MTAAPKRTIAIGEATIELARGADGRFALQSGGDTFNTAIYLARAGLNTAFATALGDDPYSDAISALAKAEGVATDLIMRIPSRLPALTLIDNDAAQGRRLHQWREATPARDLFELPGWGGIAEALATARLIYFSGMTLSLYSNVGLGRFLAAIELARKAGATIAFDGNFRPRDWKADLSRTRTVFAEALKRTDIALPAYDDEAVLWGDPSPEATIARLQAFGVGEIVVKNGPNSASLATGATREDIPVPEVVTPVDVTAVGDGFNAGYLAARISGSKPADAAQAAHRLAAHVLRHRGAIVPRTGAVMH